MNIQNNKVCFCDNCDCGQHELVLNDEGIIILKWGRDENGSIKEIKLSREQLKQIVEAGENLLNQKNLSSNDSNEINL